MVMAAELKSYPAYKDSGVEGLGAVTVHWEVRHLGRFGRLFKGGGGTKEDSRESPAFGMRALRRPVHAASVLHHRDAGMRHA